MIVSSVLLLLYALFVFLAVIECWKVYLNCTKLKAFTHMKGWPVFGNLFAFFQCDTEKIFDLPNIMMKNLHGNIFYTWMAHMLFVYTESPDVYKEILNSDKTLKKAYLYNFLRTSGIFTAEPKKWKPIRKNLNPTFGAKMINAFIPTFNEKCKKMVDLMERDLGKNVDMHPIMFKAAIDINFATSYDVSNWPIQNKRGDEIREAILRIFERVQLRAHSIFFKWDSIYKFTENYKLDNQDYPIIQDLVKAIIEAKRVDLAEKLLHGYDELAEVKKTNQINLIQKCMQLEEEQIFTIQDVRAELETVLVGSVDTSALTVSGAILLLSIHPEYQNRVVDELRTIFKNVDEPVTKEHLPMMKFTELVLKETLRHFPIAPFLARETTDDLPCQGGIIPKGAQIILNIYKSNRNPKYWGENAHEFYPERFLPENIKNTHHSHQYIPFSAGSRNCIGIRYAWASLKIALAHLLRRYKFTSNLKMHEIKIKAGLIMKITNKNPIRIEKREW